MKLTKQLHDAFKITASLNLNISSHPQEVYFRLFRGQYLIKEILIQHCEKDDEFVTKNRDIGDWGSFVTALQETAEYLEKEAAAITKREKNNTRDFELTLKTMGYNE